MEWGGIRCILFTFFTAKISGRARENVIRLTDFLLILPAFLSALVSSAPFFFHDDFFLFFLSLSLLFYDISCLKAENWSKLARTRD